jgi:hypothetical protein
MSRFAPLFADPRLLKFGNSFKAQETSVDSTQILLGLTCLAIAITILWYISRAMERRDRRGHFDSSLGLFLNLGKAHNLSWPQRWLLWQLARCHQLDEPARLFLEPEHFNSANLSDSLRAKHDQLKLISRRIFAERVATPSKTDTTSKTETGSTTARESLAPIPERPCSISFPIDKNPALDVPLWPSESDPMEGFPIDR